MFEDGEGSDTFAVRFAFGRRLPLVFFT